MSASSLPYAQQVHRFTPAWALYPWAKEISQRDKDGNEKVVCTICTEVSELLGKAAPPSLTAKSDTRRAGPCARAWGRGRGRGVSRLRPGGPGVPSPSGPPASGTPGPVARWQQQQQGAQQAPTSAGASSGSARASLQGCVCVCVCVCARASVCVCVCFICERMRMLFGREANGQG